MLNQEELMADPQYIARLRDVILDLHGHLARHRESSAVESLNGKPKWTGIVEVFELVGDVSPRWCYAWSSAKGNPGAPERLFAVVQKPPVISPRTAVEFAEAQLAAEVELQSNRPTRLA
jgi:hypothetical protein